MTKFTPFEVVNVKLSEFAAKRRLFTRSEWTDFLVKSVGLNPAAYDEESEALDFAEARPPRGIQLQHPRAWTQGNGEDLPLPKRLLLYKTHLRVAG